MDDKKFKIVIALLIVGVLGFAMFGQGDNPNSVANSQGSQNFYGNEDSPVTITEFVDYQCEACFAYYPQMSQIKEMYEDQVLFQIRNFPITSGHQFAFQAARAAEAAAVQGKFWEMHDKIFEGQKTWERAQNPASYFDQYAEEIGLDMEQYQTDRDSEFVASIISKDLDDVQELGGSGTPTFAINGVKVENPGPSVEALSAMIDAALEEAGITPAPTTVQSAGGQSTPAPSSDGLLPGETQEEHDRETQQ